MVDGFVDLRDNVDEEPAVDSFGESISENKVGPLKLFSIDLTYFSKLRWKTDQKCPEQ